MFGDNISEKEKAKTALIKSNNPPLAGGEKYDRK